MGRDFAEENRAKFTQFPVTHAADARKSRSLADKTAPSAARNVGEHNVRRHAALVGQVFAQGAEFFEEDFVAGDFANARPGRLDRLDGPGERDLPPRFERRAAGVGEFNDVEFFRILEKKTEPDQFTANGAPFGARMFAANIVGGKRLMAKFANFSVSAPQSTSTTC